MVYNNKKHFYDPYDSLDAEWKARISHEMLSVGEAARLSGFSRQYINKLIANGIIDAKKNNDGNYVIAWIKFVRWFSALPTTPTSPIGYASYSLKELMRYTGMSRCWVLKFATRNSIPSYYVGMYRRFCKSACEEAWKREFIALKRWLTIEEACTLFDVDAEVIFALVALHRTRVKRQNKSLFYNKADILSVVKKGGTLIQLPLSLPAIRVLGEPKSEGKVFPMITESILVTHVDRWISKAKIRKHITFHCFRHTFAMQLLDKGVDIYTIAALLGHRQVSSTQNYAKMTSRKMIEAIVKME